MGNDFATMRMLISLLPEEEVLEKAITQLTEYRDKLKNKDNSKKEESAPTSKFDTLKNLLSGKKPDSKPEMDIEDKPIMAIMALLLKWGDDGKSPFEIMSDSAEIEFAAGQINKRGDGK